VLQPVEVDPHRFCKDARTWETQSDVAAFPRLAAEFTQGALACRVIGQADQRGGLGLRLSIRGEVELACQRCMGAMKWPIEIERVVHLARSEAELERLDASQDSDAVLVGETLDLVSLVEDEVLLSLPFAAMHAEGECPSVG
jgi:uncharacterized protein